MNKDIFHIFSATIIFISIDCAANVLPCFFQASNNNHGNERGSDVSLFATFEMVSSSGVLNRTVTATALFNGDPKGFKVVKAYCNPSEPINLSTCNSLKTFI